jgi:hypothetical protein
MKTITAQSIPVSVSHEIVTDPKTHQVHVHCKFEANGKSITHVLTVGATDETLSEAYTAANLQEDVDTFKQKHGERFASKLRALDLANSLTE